MQETTYFFEVAFQGGRLCCFLSDVSSLGRVVAELLDLCNHASSTFEGCRKIPRFAVFFAEDNFETPTHCGRCFFVWARILSNLNGIIHRRSQDGFFFLFRHLAGGPELLGGNRTFPEDSKARLTCRQLAVALQPDGGFLNNESVVIFLRIIQADKAIVLSDALQHQDRTVLRRMPQHFIIDAQSTADIVLFLKAFPHHQAGMQADLIGSTAGVDLFEQLCSLNQCLFAFFGTFIKRLSSFIGAADKVE